MVYQLDADQLIFPHPQLAEEDGLLAIGGDLSVERLLLAYQYGIFPWYNPDDPICWYSPDPRCVIYPESIQISKSMKKILQQQVFKFTYNRCFEEIVKGCALSKRKDQDGTWISDEITEAYTILHQLGYANSVEVWKQDTLVGGLYGVLVGQIFVGESMFSAVPNASKAALIHLCTLFDLELIDCQVPNDHLFSMGAQLLSRSVYLEKLSKQTITPHGFQKLLRHSG